MKRQKVLKSSCAKAWLFDVAEEEDFLLAGFACYVPGCASETEVEINGTKRMVMTPSRAVNSPMPLRIANARLSLLPLDQDE
jgi:hypothetical protein